MSSPRKARALQPGEPISVVTPASAFDVAAFEKGLAVLRARGHEPVAPETIYRRERYLAGGDALRASVLQEAFADRKTGAVLCARGGYGSMRLLPALKLKGLSPKAFCGFSDITSLHLSLNREGWITVHGPVITQLGKLGAPAQERLFKLLEDPAAPEPLAGEPVVKGRAKGRLLGGNLSLLTRLIGTPYLPSLKGAVLLIEEVGERPYRLDRMWSHLQLAGLLDGIAGVAVGELTECEEKGESYTAREVMLDLLRGLSVPSLFGLPIGHGEDNRAVPLGARVTLDADRGTLFFEEGAVE